MSENIYNPLNIINMISYDISYDISLFFLFGRKDLYQDEKKIIKSSNQVKELENTLFRYI